MVAPIGQWNSDMAKQAGGNISATALAQVRILEALSDEALAALAEKCTWSCHDGGSEAVSYTHLTLPTILLV